MTGSSNNRSHLSDSDLEALISQFQASDARELHVRTDEFEIFLSKDPASPAPWGTTGEPTPTGSPPTRPKKGSDSPKDTAEKPATMADAPDDLPEGHEIVRAPYLGTFYRSPKPGEPHFVEIGDAIAPGKDLCLVEVMKLFTAVRSEVAGIVREIYAEDGQMVEEGQPLFAIEPEG